eukprot:scaffold14881_cov165-Alexandrium_tamarense.AAC.1
MPFFEDDEKETSNVESAEEGTKGASKPIIKDASSTVAIRVVLERYDMASIRDHVDRVRSLLEGNAPHVKKLFVEEENAAEDTKQADEESKEPVTEGDDKEKSDEVKAKDKAKDEEEERKKLREEIIKAMPIFPEDMDLSFKSATSGDLTDFYYLACGEEEALRQHGGKRKKNNGRLALEEAENIDSSKSGKTKKSKPK